RLHVVTHPAIGTTYIGQVVQNVRAVVGTALVDSLKERERLLVILNRLFIISVPLGDITEIRKSGSHAILVGKGPRTCVASSQLSCECKALLRILFRLFITRRVDVKRSEISQYIDEVSFQTRFFEE